MASPEAESVWFLGSVGGAVVEGAADGAEGDEVDGDGAVVGGAGFGRGADDFQLAAEASDDAALGRDFLLTTHVDHDFFGLVLIVELIHELAGVRHHRVGSPPNLRVICAFFVMGVRGCVGLVAYG